MNRIPIDPRQQALPFGPAPERGVPFLRQGARIFAEARGRKYDPTGLEEMQADSAWQQKVGARYLSIQKDVEAGKQYAPAKTKASYQALRDETAEQYDFLTKPEHEGGLGVKVEYHDDDPYPDNASMIKDIHENRRLKVFRTASTGGAEHAEMPEEINDKFRAVHDAFGHATIGSSFSRHGEERAWHSHQQMYSPEARPAMTTETRMNNSVLNFTQHGGFPKGTPFAAPEWAMRDRRPKR
jgi:hypothetical protein